MVNLSEAIDFQQLVLPTDGGEGFFDKRLRISSLGLGEGSDGEGG